MERRDASPGQSTREQESQLRRISYDPFISHAIQGMEMVVEDQGLPFIESGRVDVRAVISNRESQTGVGTGIYQGVVSGRSFHEIWL